MSSADTAGQRRRKAAQEPGEGSASELLMASKDIKGLGIRDWGLVSLEPNAPIPNPQSLPVTPPDERSTAPGGYRLWLLTFVPDQVHRPPLQGPLVGGRDVRPTRLFVRDGRRLVKGGAAALRLSRVHRRHLAKLVLAVAAEKNRQISPAYRGENDPAEQQRVPNRVGLAKRQGDQADNQA